MPPSVYYHCPCLAGSPVPPPPHLPSSAFSFHPLHTLFFCEECDAIRCNRCVAVEVSTYYCPNCLFEVPSASVRAEKNRCARNCFLCPICQNTLSVVPSDPPGSDRLAVPITTVGEPPFYLYCNHCRWDSVEVGIVFEKPTGLAAQLQRHEDSAPDSLEFDRLKEHFEPFIRASNLSASSSANPSSAAHSLHLYSSSITAAASAALARDIPGVAKYTPSFARSTSGRSGRDRSANRDEMSDYRSRLDIATASIVGTGGGDADVEFMKHVENVGDVASLEQRWENSWATSLKTRYVFLLSTLSQAHIALGTLSRFGYHFTQNGQSVVQCVHISSSSRNRKHSLFATKSNWSLPTTFRLLPLPYLIPFPLLILSNGPWPRHRPHQPRMIHSTWDCIQERHIPSTLP